MTNIVVGVDGSDTARQAAEAAAEMARRYDSTLHLVMSVPKVTVDSVGGPEAFTVSSFELAEQALLRLSSELKGDTALQVTTAAVVGDPASALCEQARSVDAWVIIVGNKRTQGMARVLGSVATDVVKAAPCAVHIVHTFP